MNDRRRAESGLSMVALLAAMSIMFIMMSAAVPAWRYVMKDAREEELLFRGGQIADAIQRYQAKFKNPPPSLEVMVQQRVLRKAYKDPFAKDGKWRYIRAGEQALPPGVPTPGGPSPSPSPSASPGGRDRGGSPTGGLSGGLANQPGQPPLGTGAFVGVASYSKDKSLRIFNGRTRYNEWLFIAGQPRLLGRQVGVVPNPGVTPRPAASGAPNIRGPEQK